MPVESYNVVSSTGVRLKETKLQKNSQGIMLDWVSPNTADSLFQKYSNTVLQNTGKQSLVIFMAKSENW